MKIGWVLVGGRNTASSRLLGLNVHEWLKTKRVDSHILWSPEEYNPTFTATKAYQEQMAKAFDVVLFQKTCLGDTLEFAQTLRNHGKKIIYIVDDMFHEFIPMIQVADVNVVSSGALVMSNWVESICGRKPTMVWEAYETTKDFCKTEYKVTNPRAIWFGTMGHLPQAYEIHGVLQNLGYEYLTVSAGPDAMRQWSLDTIWNDVKESDVVVMPYLGSMPEVEQAKGTNRLIQSMVIGLPCVSSPYNSYMNIVKQGKTGYICYNNTKEEWEMYLRMLQDWELRKDIGQAAREQVKDAYNIDTLGKDWLKLLGLE